ncbi:hypothetical protein [Flavobacterium sp. UBA7682]|uniref:hypothetical protein n=1 Tax=Flavobacterium sp. UBA7682 TaxID=1946560 RepID=UPI0025BC23A3|nr:hypothetical protein [Flavobacterium sp. UBA7682]
MFTIYSDKLIFEDIISSGKCPNWEKIIINHSVIHLDINNVDLNSDLNDPNSIIFQFLLSSGKQIDIYEADTFFQKIYANNKTVVENPTAAYFLNLTDKETEQLQEETGIIVNNGVKVDDELLLKGIYSHWVADEMIVNNWKTILNVFKNFPSNSIIINDRNLFTNKETVGGKELNLGTNNILRILDAVLPDKLNVDYHIIIQADHQPKWPGVDNKSKCDGVSIFLDTEIRKLRPYNFIIEMIFSHPSTQYYVHTHNRRILSNYKTGSVSHCFSAFQLRIPDKTKNDDNLNLNAFFDKIYNSASKDSNLKEHTIGTQRIKELSANCIAKINANGPNDYAYRYYLNGVEVIKGQSTTIKNRLLN